MSTDEASDAPDKTCALCGQLESFYCLNDDGSTRPMCIENCGEHRGGCESYEGRCRDCGIQFMLDRMQCSVCTRMRYRRDTDTRGGQLAVSVAQSLWGDRCECPEPLPPTIAETGARTEPPPPPR